MVREIVQNILVYVVMTTVLKGLISNKGFLEIFRFVSGMILLLLFLSPIVSALSIDTGWYEKLEENILQVDRKQIEQELAVADGSFEDVLLRECEIQVRQQLREMAEDAGQKPEQIQVSMKKSEDGEVFVERIQLKVNEETQQVMAQMEDTEEESQRNVEPIENIQIDSETGRQREQEDKESVSEDEDTRMLKKKICKKFALSKGAVDVWKTNGRNY